MKTEKNHQSAKSAARSKFTRIGSYSFVITIIVIAAAVIVNLIVNQLPTTYTELDVSSTELYTLSDQTEEIVSSVDEDITIYWIVQSDNENSSIEHLLNRYQDLNNHIKVTKVDPVVSPTFVTQYTDAEISNNSLIVESSKRYKYIDYYDIMVIDASTYYYTGEYSWEFDGESCLTSAIDYVTSDSLPVAYNLTGHGELTLEDDMASKIADQNVEVQDLNLLTTGSIPEDCSALFLLSPKSDLSEQEAEQVLAYLQNGGHLFLITDFTRGECPNLDAIMEAYGVSSVEGIVIEGDANAAIYQNPSYILPTINSHAITDPLISAGLQAIVPFAQGIAVADDLRDGLEVTKLLETSELSYSKTAGINLTTFDKEEGDVDGPFALGVAISEPAANGGTTQIVWLSTSYLLDANTDLTGGNADLILNSIGWLCEHESAISIHSKNMVQDSLVVPAISAIILSALLIVVLPLVILITGIVITVRRRRR
jgi:ABC-2 type transport system permease protein